MGIGAIRSERLRRWRRAAIEVLPWLVGAGALAVWTTHTILEASGGEAAVPLDDSYIHFQYARAFSRGAPFEYTPGAEPTPGATSVLWPLVLAPWVAVGIGDTSLIWVAWAIGWASLAALAHETRLLARGLVSEGAAAMAGLSVLAFGGFAWFAASGMEVVPFAWLITRAMRRSSEWLERDRDPPGAKELVAYAWLAPLARPEGVIVSIAVAAALAFRPPAKKLWPALVALGGVLAPSAVYLVAAGSPLSSTATAKWLPLNPYFRGSTLASAVNYNVRLLFETLLDGQLWTSVFLPTGGRSLAWLSLAALPLAGFVLNRRGRGLLTLTLALGALIPTTYETFLVNRVRYLWPFASAWLVGLVIIADSIGALAHRWLKSPRGMGAALGGVVAGLLASRLPRSIDDVAESASAVTRQQVALGRWVRDHLPESAVIGVNDTGAIAYFGGRRTFDVVGLTTRDEARYWSAGPGARFEHYERLPPERRPTHFVVYPEWFAIEPLLGTFLTERTVHATILGGPMMAAYEARYDALGSATSPLLVKPPGRLIDELDVSDVESEAAHGYELFDATRERSVVFEHGDAADGGRLLRRRETFDIQLAPGATFVMRLGATEPVRLEVAVGGRKAGSVTLEGMAWEEHVLVLPSDVPRGRARLELSAGSGSFSALHYWVFE